MKVFRPFKKIFLIIVILLISNVSSLRDHNPLLSIRSSLLPKDHYKALPPLTISFWVNAKIINNGINATVDAAIIRPTWLPY